MGLASGDSGGALAAIFSLHRHDCFPSKRHKRLREELLILLTSQESGALAGIVVLSFR